MSKQPQPQTHSEAFCKPARRPAQEQCSSPPRKRSSRRNERRSLGFESLEARLALTGAASLTVFVNSQPVAIPNNVGKFADGTSALVSTTDTNGRLSFDDSAPRTVGDFFQTWRTNAGLAGNNPNATFSSTELMGNQASSLNTVQMFVNGQLATDYASHPLSNNDRIVLVYGSNPVVALNTNFGPIVLELFETRTPGTVNNFLNYVNRGDYLNSFFHRVDDNFVIQGGGFKTSSTTFVSTAQFTEIVTDPPIQNEPGVSNLRGTVAMAKTSDPHSATSQFFVNLSNDNTFLDSPSNSGGFTAFGQVLDMNAADTISRLPVNTSNPAPYGELPVSSTGQLPVVQSLVGNGDMTGTAFLDANANGIRDTGETPLAGVRIYVDGNNNGVFDSGEISTVTDGNGNYLLQAAPGSRVVRAVPPANHNVTLPTTGNHTRSLQIGRTIADLNFGFSAQAAAIDTGLSSGFMGRVYVDSNNNGQPDSNEAGVPGVLITLAGVSSGTSLVRTTLTDDQGFYKFDDVPTGTYSLTERQPAALLDGSDSTTVPGATVGNDQISNIAFTSGQKFANNNFGELRLLSDYINITWFFVSSTLGGHSPLREAVALGEQLNGDHQLAATIRSGNGEAPHGGGGGSVPVSVADSYSVNANAVLNVTAASGVLANDADADQDGLTAVLVSSVAHGSLALRADGSFTYTPTTGFSGSDSFTYVAFDGTLSSTATTVSLLVVGINGVPTAANDSYTADQSTTLTVTVADGVLKNDVDPDGDTLTAQVVNQPAHGTVSLSGNGSFTYTPATGYSGSDAFTYRVSDGTNVSNTATVSVTVRPAPGGVADSYTTDENSPLSVTAANGVLANDSNPDSGALTAILGATTTHGTLQLNADGSFQYVPNANFFGTDTFTYQAIKGPRSSALTTVTINVQSVNSPPVAVGNLYTVNEDLALNVTAVNGVLANDTDADGDTLTAIKVSDPSAGALVFNADGSFTYTPVANFNGNVTFTYRASDGQTTSDIATVTISVAPVNDPPTAVDDAYVVAVNGTLNVNVANGVLANDSDIDGDSLSVTISVQPLHGTVTLQPDGSFVYTPNPGFRGTDAFQYQLSDLPPDSDCELICTEDGTIIGSDGLIHTDTGTVTIEVNNPPTTLGDEYEVEEDQVLNVSAASGVLANDTDDESDPLTAILVTGAAHGTVTLASSGAFTYTPNANYSGSDSFTYRAHDGFHASVVTTVSLTVQGVNDAPVGAADKYQVATNSQLTVPSDQGVLSNDQDPDNDVLVAELVSDVAHGMLVLNPNGSFEYAPAADFHGTDSFTYRASDGELTSAVITVLIEVNSTPLVQDDAYSLDEDTTLTVGLANGVLQNDQDIDEDPLLATLVSTTTHGQLVFESNGTFVYTPFANFHGVDSFVYRVSDGFVSSANATVTITINSINDPPIPQADSYAVNEDEVLTVSAVLGVLKNDTDADDDELSATLVANASHGSVTLNPDGSFSYVPAPNFHGADSFRYRVTDGIATSADVTVSIAVAPRNDAPVAAGDSYTVEQNGVLNVSAAQGVLQNDTDVDGDTLTASVIVPPGNGALALNSNGSFTYTPPAGFVGTVTFSYTASDGQATSAAATVTIQVLAPNVFQIAAQSPAGTLVGQVTPTGTVGTTRVYDFVNTALPDDLQLAADDHMVGAVSAPVVLIEYLDIQCPPCATYHPVIRQLEEDFEGQLLVVRRHLPLTSIHFNAVPAARAAEAAHRQGKFDDFINLAFTNQSSWAGLADPQPQFESFATQLGLNLTQFRNDLADPVIAARVQRDLDAAGRLAANSTPTFYLNGQKLSGPPASASGFGAIIQSALDQNSAAFSLNRLTGELRVADSSLLNPASNPTFNLNIRVRDLNGVNQVVPVTINVVSAAQGEGEGDAFFDDASLYRQSADNLFDAVDSWLDQ